MEVELVGGLCVYARESTTFAPIGSGGFVVTTINVPTQVVWVRCQPTEEGATLFVQLDLQLRNKSSIDDGVTGAQLLLHKEEGSTVVGLAERQRGKPFHGENVKANSLVALRLQFEFEHVNYRQFPSWTYQADTKYDVEVATMRGPACHVEVEPAGLTPAGNEGDFVSV
jgi:hypothetical protein